MDQIAGELAFYSDLFLPLLTRHQLDLKTPSLAALLKFHDAAFPFASVQATLIAALRQSPTPCVLIEAKSELKASEQRGRSQGVLFSEMVPEPLLRAVTTAHNPEAIRRKFYVHRWMRVPDQSVIRLVFDGDSTRERVRVKENLSWWESQGETLANCPIVVEAMRAGSGRVLALVTKPE